MSVEPGGSRARTENAERNDRRRDRRLKSLAYLGEIPLQDDDSGDKVGVTHHDDAFEGYLLANTAGSGKTRRRGKSSKIREATLWSARGELLHRWTADVLGNDRSWAITRLDAAGALYLVAADSAFVKLDWDSKPIWTVLGRFHHDFGFDGEGGFAVLTERPREIPTPQFGGPVDTTVRILDHGVTFISADGRVTEQLWLYDALVDHPDFAWHVYRRSRHRRDDALAEEGLAQRGGGLDVFHSNSVLLLPRDVPGLGRRGDVLVSLRHMNLVVVIDRRTHRRVWSWGGDHLTRQHDATLTPEGKLVLFDNRTRDQGSRALVIDPRTKKIEREIGGSSAVGPLAFFSMGRGLAQALPGGNIMVVVSNEGRAFEVTPEGEVAWEFWSPWIRHRTRLPIRASRLEGAVQAGLARIVAGTQRPPRRALGARAPVVHVDIDGG